MKYFIFLCYDCIVQSVFVDAVLLYHTSVNKNIVYTQDYFDNTLRFIGLELSHKGRQDN